MGFYRAQVVLGSDSTLGKDAAVNVTHWRSEGTWPDDVAAVIGIETALTEFYDSVSDLLSSNIDPTNVRIKIYNLLDAPMRTPILDNLISWGSPGTTALPGEVACCVSYRGAIASGVNRRRNRGRFYLGPLAQQAVEDTVGDVRVTPAAQTTITNAVSASLLAPAESSIDWSVFSRSNALGLDVGEPQPDQEPTYTAVQLALGFRDVVAAYVDDALDTQRRRGHSPTNRVTVLG